ncbi:hypothetical protein EX399_10150 [Salmonella enterica]|nr:hypothetical protein [Salmonella enterica]
MKVKNSLILIGLFFASIGTATAGPNNWVVGGEGGWREIFATNTEGYTLNFTCDMGAKEGTDDHAAGRMLYLSGGKGDKSIDVSTKWSIESIPSVISLKVGNDSYDIQNQATAPARREWYRFWADTVKNSSQKVAVFVDGRKVTIFDLAGIASIYKDAPQDGCLKQDTN